MPATCSGTGDRLAPESMIGIVRNTRGGVIASLAAKCCREAARQHGAFSARSLHDERRRVAAPAHMRSTTAAIEQAASSVRGLARAGSAGSHLFDMRSTFLTSQELQASGCVSSLTLAFMGLTIQGLLEPKQIAASASADGTEGISVASHSFHSPIEHFTTATEETMSFNRILSSLLLTAFLLLVGNMAYAAGDDDNASDPWINCSNALTPDQLLFAIDAESFRAFGKLDPDQVREHIIAAMESWNTTAGPPVPLTYDPTPVAAPYDTKRNIVYMKRCAQPGKILAYTWGTGETDLCSNNKFVVFGSFECPSEDACLSCNEGEDDSKCGACTFREWATTWAPSVPERYDLWAVATHEFGHVYRLDHNMTNLEATMYILYQADKRYAQRIPRFPDVDGLISGVFNYQKAPGNIAVAFGVPDLGEFKSMATLSDMSAITTPAVAINSANNLATGNAFAIVFNRRESALWFPRVHIIDSNDGENWSAPNLVSGHPSLWSPAAAYDEDGNLTIIFQAFARTFSQMEYYKQCANGTSEAGLIIDDTAILWIPGSPPQPLTLEPANGMVSLTAAPVHMDPSGLVLAWADNENLNPHVTTCHGGCGKDKFHCHLVEDFDGDPHPAVFATEHAALGVSIGCPRDGTNVCRLVWNGDSDSVAGPLPLTVGEVTILSDGTVATLPAWYESGLYARHSTLAFTIAGCNGSAFTQDFFDPFPHSSSIDRTVELLYSNVGSKMFHIHGTPYLMKDNRSGIGADLAYGNAFPPGVFFARVTY